MKTFALFCDHIGAYTCVHYHDKVLALKTKSSG